MAFVNTTAVASPASVTSVVVDVVHYGYARVLADLLPPGRAFTRREGKVLSRLLRGLAMELSRVQRRGRRFLAECDPATALVSLEWWEILLGLPDCEVPTTIEGRRLAAATKYAAAAGHDQSITFWTDLFAGLGYSFTQFDFGEWIMTCEDECDDALLDDSWLLLLWFVVDHGEHDALLECRVEAEQLLGMALDVHWAWSKVDLDSNSSALFGVVSNSQGVTAAVGEAGLILTSHWLLQEWTERVSGTAGRLYAVAAVGSVLIAVGEPPACYRSVDNGVTWNAVAFASDQKFAIARGPEDDEVVVAVGNDGVMYRSENAGLTWDTLAPATATLYGVTAAAGAMVAVGVGGLITRSTNNGETWGPVSSGTVETLRAVDGRGAVMVAVGDAGTVIVSYDAGGHWEAAKIDSPPERLRGVTGSTSGRWAACGDAGLIYASPNGVDWIPQTATSTADLFAAAESNPLGFACLVGASRTIVVE